MYFQGLRAGLSLQLMPTFKKFEPVIIVARPEHYLYSSARDYHFDKQVGLVQVVFLYQFLLTKWSHRLRPATLYF
jgi:hypothetical protein